MSRTKKLLFDIWGRLKLPSLLATLIGGAVVLQVAGNSYFSALGSNLIAEFIGAAATVYGIDFILKSREEKRLLPVRASSYEDVRIMTHWALGLWKDAYVNSVGDTTPKSWDDLFSDESVEKVAIGLDITKPANTLPRIPWSAYFDQEMERIHKHAEKILERHGSVLEPKVHNAVYMLVYYGGYKISNVMASDRHLGTPRPTNLGGYIPLIREWFDAVLTLHEWTVRMHMYLQRNAITSIHPPYLFSPLEAKEAPPAKFDKGVLEAQITKFRSWQEQQAASRRAV